MNKVIKTEYDAGGIETFIVERFYPLSCDDFVAAHNEKSKTFDIPVEARNIERFTPGITEPERIEKEHRKLSIDFHHSLPVYSLVPGGWLPPPFVDPPAFLLDRNVIRYIEQISKGNPQDRYTDTKWWLDMLINGEDVYISPFLYAFESGSRMIPELDEFKASYKEGVEIIRQLFPKAQVPEYKDAEYDAAMQTMEDVLKFHREETEFLQRVAPLIRTRVSDKNLESVCEDIIKIAGDLGLSLRSFAVLAAISCLYEDFDTTGFNAARNMIKLGGGGGTYTDENAYNVLSDMRGLLFYFAFRALAETREAPLLSYVTADKPAIMFGCGLNITKTEWVANKLVLKLELTKFLFPRMMDEKREELAQRFQNA